ncbi:hypothetical protein TSH58p_17480 [Azospirillum sp. TSH58]|uniref:hypothetical protein n=1 Tax=Azospirillum sp. TSH58 TaxID=664962 RepID=UPI000D5FF867|nr:hypothetical protein [Azospirillum sp. TSH58]AWJ85156.1 hypothetical protein TSH58p_17480 [Azospirillum sp. TSH58]PWC80830.1 hypothetical protein TSH58_00885 [Azospirillum sp. TSH58]
MSKVKETEFKKGQRVVFQTTSTSGGLTAERTGAVVRASTERGRIAVKEDGGEVVLNPFLKHVRAA